jgi:EpsI family protein
MCQSTPETSQGTVAGVILQLPDAVKGFTGEDQPVSEAEIRLLPKDTGFAKKAYKDSDGDQVFGQIVLAGGEKRSIHRPEICLPAQGWNLKTGGAVPITLDDGRTLDVMRLIISKPVEVRPGVTKELTTVFLYWFVGKDMTTPYHWMRLAHANWDKVVHNINHRWAYVIVSAPVLDGFTPSGKNQEETMKMLESFVGEIAPKIMEPSVQLAKK